MQIHVENTTLRYTTLIALHNTNYTTLVTVHYIKYIRTTTTTTNTATPATTTTLHCSTLHYTNCTTLQLQLIPQIQLHTHTLIRLLYNYESITLRYNYTTTLYIKQLWKRWPLQPLQPLQKTQLQLPFGPSVDLLCHSWFTVTSGIFSPNFCCSVTSPRSKSGPLPHGQAA